jgi:uncharacterized membrane protein YfcA
MHPLNLFFFGLAIGAVSGLLGIGGGILMIPGLMLLFGLSQPEAQGTSLAVLAMPILLFAAIVYYRNGYVQISTAATIAAGFAVGAVLGALFVPRVPVAGLRFGFGIMLLYLGFLFVLSPVASRSATALPAGLLSIVSTVIALVLRRRRQIPPRCDEIEYHI